MCISLECEKDGIDIDSAYLGTNQKFNVRWLGIRHIPRRCQCNLLNGTMASNSQKLSFDSNIQSVNWTVTTAATTCVDLVENEMTIRQPIINQTTHTLTLALNIYWHDHCGCMKTQSISIPFIEISLNFKRRRSAKKKNRRRIQRNGGKIHLENEIQIYFNWRFT